MKKQEAIEKLQSEAVNHYSETSGWFKEIKLDIVTDIVNQIYEPKKAAVPRYIDTWIQGAEYNGFDLYEAMTDGEIPDKVATWIVCNPETFAKAWLYGYEVEKEKLYTAKLKSTGEFLHYDEETDKVHHFCAYGNTARNSKKYHFTEDTLIQYNAWKNEAYDVNEVEE